MTCPITDSLVPPQQSSFIFKLSCTGLKWIESLPFPKDFTFIVGNNRYQCSKFSASFLSQKVFRLLSADFTVDFVDLGKVSTNDFEQIFGMININVDISHFNDFCTVCRELENEELLSQISSLFDHEDLNLEGVISRVKSKHELGMDTSVEIAFIASHFHEFQINVLESLGVSISEEVLADPSLVLLSEDSLFKMIISSGDEFECLLGQVDCQYLSDSAICEFLEVISIETLTSELWSSICHRLRHRIDISCDSHRFAKHENTLSYLYSGEPFDGILNSLRSSCSRNPHEAGEVEVTASSTQHNKPHQVLDYGWSDFWHSRDQKGSWLQIDFKDRLVCLTHYSLKSHKGGANYILAWVVEGSEDGRKWEVVDQRRTDQLAGSSKVGTFPVTSSRYFRFVRLRQTEKNSSNGNYFLLANIEVFGQVKKN